MNSIVGISINNRVFYNVLIEEPEFSNTGLAIIEYLKTNKNKFISEIIKSQSYLEIDYIYDDVVVFGELLDNSNENSDTLDNIILNHNKLDYMYIYDYTSDLLLVKTPTTDPEALDYNSVEDVREFKNQNKDISYNIEREI